MCTLHEVWGNVSCLRLWNNCDANPIHDRWNQRQKHLNKETSSSCFCNHSKTRAWVQPHPSVAIEGARATIAWVEQQSVYCLVTMVSKITTTCNKRILNFFSFTFWNGYYLRRNHNKNIYYYSFFFLHCTTKIVSSSQKISILAEISVLITPAWTHLNYFQGVVYTFIRISHNL